LKTIQLIKFGKTIVHCTKTQGMMQKYHVAIYRQTAKISQTILRSKLTGIRFQAIMDSLKGELQLEQKAIVF